MSIIWIALGDEEQVLGAVVSGSVGHARVIASERFPSTVRVMSASSFAVAEEERQASERSRRKAAA